MWQACEADPLFFINSFVWTFDPRLVDEGENPKVPFVTYPYQDEAVHCLLDGIGRHDILIEKSRDMGASWLCLTMFFWEWCFLPRRSFLMVSRKESYVDGNTDSLFAHLDFIMEGLPIWMRPRHRRRLLTLENKENNSRIEGESTTANIGRGGRRTAMLVDEFAAFIGGGYDVLSATADNTDSRIFNSTPEGTDTAFYAQRQKGTPRLRFHWSRHPGKSRGLYRVNKDGSPEILDYEFWDQYRAPGGGYYDPEDIRRKYEFRTKKPRSQEGFRSWWYDKECDRRAHEVEVATQLDIDYQGSAYPFFDLSRLDVLREKFCVEPKIRGNLDYNLTTLEPRFEPDENGELLLWIGLNKKNQPPTDRNYVIACDISQGTGASNSVASIGDDVGGEKVGELATNILPPESFADLVLSLCYFFRGTGRAAFLIWEATGPGGAFGQRIVNHHRFHHVWRQTDDTRLKRKVSDKPGWFSNRDTKRNLLTEYRAELNGRLFLNPSVSAIAEAAEYIYQPTGSIEHAGSRNTIDPSDTAENHGDRVIADALLSKVLKSRRGRYANKRGQQPHVMSFLWRRQLHQKHEARRSSIWKEYT